MIQKFFSFFWDKSLLIFLIIGGLNTIISMGGSQLLLKPLTQKWGKAAGYWGSTAIMFTLCSVTSFYFNRKYSFESQAPLGPSILKFSVVIIVCYLLGFGFSHYITPRLVKALEKHRAAKGGTAKGISSTWVTRIAMLVGQVIFTLLNYIGQRLWAFS